MNISHFIGKKLLPVALVSIWISLSEFLRNELFFKHLWESHYEKLGLIFPSDPINNLMWGIWSLLFSVLLLRFSLSLSFWNAVFYGWIAGFVMMWIVIGNLNVLPINLLAIAIPWSFFEVFISIYICSRIGDIDNA